MADERDRRAAIGRAVARALALAGWSQKEAAAALGCDAAQLARWVAGTERAHFDRLFALPALQQPLLVALAALVDEADVVTEIRLSRSA